MWFKKFTLLLIISQLNQNPLHYVLFYPNCQPEENSIEWWGRGGSSGAECNEDSTHWSPNDPTGDWYSPPFRTPLLGCIDRRERTPSKLPRDPVRRSCKWSGLRRHPSPQSLFLTPKYRSDPLSKKEPPPVLEGLSFRGVTVVKFRNWKKRSVSEVGRAYSRAVLAKRQIIRERDPFPTLEW